MKSKLPKHIWVDIGEASMFGSKSDNKTFSWNRRFWRINVGFQCRSKNCLWGRFDGGWNWKVGFQAGGNTLIINLLIADLTFWWV